MRRAVRRWRRPASSRTASPPAPPAATLGLVVQGADLRRPWECRRRGLRIATGAPGQEPDQVQEVVHGGAFGVLGGIAHLFVGAGFGASERHGVDSPHRRCAVRRSVRTVPDLAQEVFGERPSPRISRYTPARWRAPTNGGTALAALGEASTRLAKERRAVSAASWVRSPGMYVSKLASRKCKWGGLPGCAQHRCGRRSMRPFGDDTVRPIGRSSSTVPATAG